MSGYLTGKPVECIEVKIKIFPSEDGTIYAGAWVTYPPLEGEAWRRGHDLSDGEFTADLVREIAEDVIREFNLEEIHQ